MAYNFSYLKQKTKEVEEWLKKELGSVRTGRATPAVLDGVFVEAYGARVPISQVATISVEDVRTLRISPWDASQIKSIEKGILVSNIGLSVSIDDRGIRVSFPELSSERRILLVKTAKEKLEQAKISLRTSRDEVWKDVQMKEKEGSISEDEKFRLKDEMEKIIQTTQKLLEESLVKKEKEISQ